MKTKDGHTDVASARRQCANIIEDCQDEPYTSILLSKKNLKLFP